MTASLIVAGYETIGTVAAPSLWKLATLGWIKGDALPDQAEIVNRILDGEAVTGSRTRNRHPRIPLWITGANALDLAANINAIWQAVDQDTFTVQWTPDGGLPIVFDCYRARVVRPNNQNLAEQGVTALLIECDALPFGRSTTTKSVSVTSTLQIDSYDTAPTGATLNTTTKIEGTGSAQFLSNGAAISRSFAAKDLSPYASVGVWYYQTGLGGVNPATLTLTLTSASGTTRYTLGFTLSSDNQWHLVNVPLTGGTITAGTGVTLSAVTSYTLGILEPGATSSPILADDLRAGGSSSAQVSTTHAVQLLAPGVVGSARTTVSMALTNASTFSAFLLHSPPVDQDDQAAILSTLSTGSTDQTVTIAAVNSVFRGTYGIFLGVGTLGSGSITATVTVTQKEGATTVATKVLTKAYTSGAHVIPVAEVTLPLVDVPVDNTATSYTVRVQITGTDRYSELMLLDTQGQTVFTDTDLAVAVAAAYVDEPSAMQSGSPVYGSATDRTAAYGILGNCVVSGGPILLEPGTNKLLAWVATGTPILATTYPPRWLDERSS